MIPGIIAQRVVGGNAFRYIRIRFWGSNAVVFPQNTAIEVSYFGIRDTPAGSDLVPVAASAPSLYAGSATGMLDPTSGGRTSMLLIDDYFGAYVDYDYGVPIEIAEVELGQWDTSSRPHAFVIEGRNDPADDYVPFWVQTEVDWTSSANKIYTVPQATSLTYYILNITGTSGAVGIATAEWRNGGTDIGGTVCANKAYNSTFPGSRARNGDPSTFWTNAGSVWSGSEGDAWIGLMTVSASVVDSVYLQVRPDGFREDPTTLKILRSTDGYNFTTLQTHTGISAWTAGEARSFAV